MPKIVQIGMGGSDVAAPPTELTTNLDPALLFEDGTTGEDFIKVDTTTDANKLVLLGTFTEADNQSSGFTGIREGTPKAPLHIVGTGGSTGMTIDPTNHGSPTLFIENSTNNSKSKCLLALNSDGSNGSQIELKQGDTDRLRVTGSNSTAQIDSLSVPLKFVSSAGSGQYINFTSGGVERLRIDNGGEIATGAEATPLCAASGGVHIQTGTGSTLGSAHASADDLVVEGATHTGMTFITGGTTNNTYIMFADDGDNSVGAIYYGHSNNRLELKAGGTFISTFTNTGQVNGAELTADYLFQAQDGEMGIVANSADANGQSLVFTKSRNATDGSHTIVDDDDVLGEIEFKGSDGNSFELGAKIIARVDGTPSEGSDMPTELVFAVSEDGSATPTERLRIASSGALTNFGSIGAGDGNAGSPGFTFRDENDVGMYRGGTDQLGFSTGGTQRFYINATGEISTGDSTANPSTNAEPGSVHIKTATSGHTQVHEDWDDLVIESGSGSRVGITLMSNTDGKGAITFSDPGSAQAGSFQYNHDLDLFDFVATIPGTGASTASVLKVDGNGQITPQKGPYLYHQGTGADTADTQPVYLPSASSGAKLVVDFQNGNFGDITLTAAVTAIEFHNVPADGTCATVTAKITQGSSNHTIDYSDSAVTVYSDGGSTAVTGEIKFSGGIHHTQSTGSGDVDLISFTSIPNGSTFNIFAAVIGQDFS